MREMIMNSNICTTHTRNTATFNVGNSETDRWARTIGTNLAVILGMKSGIQKAWLGARSGVHREGDWDG